jgi:hypothetical protein
VQDRHHQVESGAILRAEERKKTTTNKQKSQREPKKETEILPELWKLALLV